MENIEIIAIARFLQLVCIIGGFITIGRWYHLSWQIKNNKGKSFSQIEKEKLLLKTKQRKEALL
jgi:hypothetical protein